MGPIEDIIKCKLYDKFYQRNKTLFKKDPVEYWIECRRYLEKHFRDELGDYLGNELKEGRIQVDVNPGGLEKK